MPNLRTCKAILPPWGLGLCLVIAAMAGSAFAQTGNAPGSIVGSLQGVVSSVDQQGQSSPVPGIQVSLRPVDAGDAPISTVTNEEGRYRFEALAARPYRLEVNLAGFEPIVQTVDMSRGGDLVQNLSLRLASVVESVEVYGEASPITTQSSSTTATVTETQIDALPIAARKFEATLPLVPGVVRTWEGELNIKGVPENQGMLLVDSAETVDPVTGSFSIPIPLDAIRSISVSKTPYSAEYGGFSGGLVIIQTKPPSDRWLFGVEDFLPSFRGKNGKLVGLADVKPRVHFSGPLIPGKLGFSEAFSYEWERRPVRGLPWPFNEIKTRAFDTLTGLQVTLTPRHLLSGTLNGFTLRRQFANINTLVPQSASADNNHYGISLGVTDNYEFASGKILSTIFRYGRFHTEGRAQGSEDMLITPEGWGGNFFNTFKRVSDQYQVLSTLGLPARSWLGSHELKFGVDFTHRSYDGASLSRPIQLLREDGSLAVRIDFQGTGKVGGRDTELSGFVQDQWKVNSRLTADLGARLVSQSAGRAAALAPRAGIAFTPDNGNTLIRAGTGIFHDRVPLLATGFTDNPSRVVSYFDTNSQPAGPPTVFENVYFQSSIGNISNRWDGSARNFTWNVEVDRDLGRGLTIRASYLSSQTTNVPTVTPLTGPPGGPSYLGLANFGKSRYSEFEATVHYRSERHEVNVSYIHSRSRGDLNAVSTIYVPFEQPVIRPNLSGILPSDIPNRLVGWGTFSLPWKVTFSPVVDVHSGLPYYVVDEFQNYVGMPNTARLPYFFSLDVKIFREVPLHWLPFKGLQGHKLRAGVYSLNFTSHQNPRDVFNNVTSPIFGVVGGIQRRQSGFVFELVN